MSLFDDMAVFVRAVEAGSFSGAAQRLGIAKSVVSRRIGSLEARLGTSLFHRTTRRLSLTETGIAYFDRARRILSDVAEADDVARRLQGELKGKLRVAAPMSFGWRHLSPAIMEFLSIHPQLEVDLDLNDRRVDLVSEGYDLAIRIGKLADSSLIARTLAPCRHVACASPAYLAARGMPITPADLAAQGHDCLVYSNRPAAEQWRFRVGGEWWDAPVVPRRLSVNNGEALREAALAGLGLIVLPTFIVGDAVAAGTLTLVLPDYEFFDPSIHAIWPPNRHLSAKIRALVDFLTERFDGVPYWDQPLLGLQHGLERVGVNDGSPD
ncbi:MAG: putative LysR family transcriptional regulator [Bradyrhizobium sp.]|nr:putative LysR family transcriptional regulator [Bradyrhizobium sp.]